MMPSFCAYLGVEVPGSKVATFLHFSCQVCFAQLVSGPYVNLFEGFTYFIYVCVCVSLYLSCFEGLIPLSNWHVDTVDTWQIRPC